MQKDIKNINPSTHFNTQENTKPLVKKTRTQIALSRIRRKIFKHVWLIRLTGVLVFIFCLFLFYLLISSLINKTGINRYVDLGYDYVFTPEEKIRSINDKTNVLILGKGGVGHDAPDLTDTMIFASFSHKDKGVVLISLPRDIWITPLRAKLNSIYYWGNKKTEGGGLVLAKATAEEIVGEPIQYAVVIDFSGFKKVIDIVGPIEVDIENSFIDNKYPIAGKEEDLCGGDPEYKCRYETIEFNKGKVIMDGETALKFARSRNAEGDEGTDLARAKRQQRIIDGLKAKILSREVVLSPKTLIALKDTVISYTETDIDPSAAVILARRAYDSRENSHSYILPDTLLANPPVSPLYDNLYVFIPKDKNWNGVHAWVDCVSAGTDGCK